MQNRPRWFTPSRSVRCISYNLLRSGTRCCPAEIAEYAVGHVYLADHDRCVIRNGLQLFVGRKGERPADHPIDGVVGGNIGRPASDKMHRVRYVCCLDRSLTYMWIGDRNTDQTV